METEENQKLKFGMLIVFEVCKYRFSAWEIHPTEIGTV
jgi:hypothetical protein